MSDISKYVIEQIKDEGIKPRPRWQFVTMSVLLGLCLIGAVTCGGLVMSLILLKLSNTQWDYVSFVGEGGLPTVLDVLPIIWIGLMILALLISIWAFEHTEGGYKYKPVFVILGVIILSGALGGVVYATQGADVVDALLQENVPSYQEMEEKVESKFHLPESGILPGHVVKVHSATTMQLEDLRQHLWNVELSEEVMLPAKHNLVHNFEGLEEGMTIFVIGEKRDEDNFVARAIRKKGRLPPPPILRERLRKKFIRNHPDLRLMIPQREATR